MLRKERADWTDRGVALLKTVLRRRRIDEWEVTAGDFTWPVSGDFVRSSARTPNLLGEEDGRAYWAFNGEVYSTPELWLGADEVRALVLERENKTKAKVARAMAVRAEVDELEAGGRQPIADDVKMFVWQRDGGRCVRCGSNQNLEFDHIIPVAMGGANTARNLQLLCVGCNRSKGASLV